MQSRMKPGRDCNLITIEEAAPDWSAAAIAIDTADVTFHSESTAAFLQNYVSLSAASCLLLNNIQPLQLVKRLTLKCKVLLSTPKRYNTACSELLAGRLRVVVNDLAVRLVEAGCQVGLSNGQSRQHCRYLVPEALHGSTRFTSNEPSRTQCACV